MEPDIYLVHDLENESLKWNEIMAKNGHFEGALLAHTGSQ